MASESNGKFLYEKSKKENSFVDYNKKLQNDFSDLKITINKEIYDEIGLPNEHWEMDKFLSKNNLFIEDVYIYKEVFAFLKNQCWKFYDNTYILNSRDANDRFIIPNTIDFIKKMKSWEYDYSFVNSLLNFENKSLLEVFGNVRAIKFLWWTDVIDYCKNTSIVRISNYIKNKNINIDFWDGIQVNRYESKFNLYIMMWNFYDKYKDTYNLDLSSEEWIKNIIDSFVQRTKEKFTEKYEGIIFFSVNQYDSWKQFENDGRLWDDLEKLVAKGNFYNVKCNYEFAKENILEKIKSLQSKWKKKILLYISCHGSENWDSYFNDYSWIWKIQKIFTKNDMDEFSKANQQWTCEFDKCYGMKNYNSNVSVIWWNYVSTTRPKKLLIDYLENDSNYNKSKFLQLLNSQSYVNMNI